MPIKNIFKIALRGLRRRKLRTALTSFAVFIGAFLIVLFISAALGGKEVILSQLTSQLDLRTIIVGREGSLMGFTNPTQLNEVDTEKAEPKLLDAVAVEDIGKIDHVQKVLPVIMTPISQMEVIDTGNKFNQMFSGGIDYAEMDSYVKEVLAGEDRNLNVDEVAIGKNIADAIELPYDQLIGKEVIVKPDPSSFFSSKRKDTGFQMNLKIAAVIDIGQDNSQFLMSPQKALEYAVEIGEFASPEDYLNEIGYDNLFVQVDEVENAQGVADKVNEIGYEALTVTSLLKLFDNIFLIIQAVFSMFGIIALIVASVGIANTMVMSVYERTKEIGMMKAIGATKGDIRMIFIIEAAVIGLIGGIAGLLFSIGLSSGIEVLLQKFVFEPQDLTIDQIFIIPLWLSLGVVLLSTTVGMISGLIPANKAAKLDPIEALAFE